MIIWNHLLKSSNLTRFHLWGRATQRNEKIRDDISENALKTAFHLSATHNDPLYQLEE